MTRGTNGRISFMSTSPHAPDSQYHRKHFHKTARQRLCDKGNRVFDTGRMNRFGTAFQLEQGEIRTQMMFNLIVDPGCRPVSPAGPMSVIGCPEVLMQIPLLFSRGFMIETEH